MTPAPLVVHNYMAAKLAIVAALREDYHDAIDRAADAQHAFLSWPTPANELAHEAAEEAAYRLYGLYADALASLAATK